MFGSEVFFILFSSFGDKKRQNSPYLLRVSNDQIAESLKITDLGNEVSQQEMLISYVSAIFLMLSLTCLNLYLIQNTWMTLIFM